MGGAGASRHSAIRVGRCRPVPGGHDAGSRVERRHFKVSLAVVCGGRGQLCDVTGCFEAVWPPCRSACCWPAVHRGPRERPAHLGGAGRGVCMAAREAAQGGAHQPVAAQRAASQGGRERAGSGDGGGVGARRCRQRRPGDGHHAGGGGAPPATAGRCPLPRAAAEPGRADHLAVVLGHPMGALVDDRAAGDYIWNLVRSMATAMRGGDLPSLTVTVPADTRDFGRAVDEVRRSGVRSARRSSMRRPCLRRGPSRPPTASGTPPRPGATQRRRTTSSGSSPRRCANWARRAPTGRPWRADCARSGTGDHQDVRLRAGQRRPDPGHRAVPLPGREGAVPFPGRLRECDARLRQPLREYDARLRATPGATSAAGTAAGRRAASRRSGRSGSTAGRSPRRTPHGPCRRTPDRAGPYARAPAYRCASPP